MQTCRGVVVRRSSLEYLFEMFQCQKASFWILGVGSVWVVIAFVILMVVVGVFWWFRMLFWWVLFGGVWWGSMVPGVYVDVFFWCVCFVGFRLGPQPAQSTRFSL